MQGGSVTSAWVLECSITHTLIFKYYLKVEKKKSSQSGTDYFSFVHFGNQGYSA